MNFLEKMRVNYIARIPALFLEKIQKTQTSLIDWRDRYSGVERNQR